MTDLDFDKHIYGKFGENLACNYLTELGYKILVKNYRTALGEIDIIAEKDGVTIFVEVKAKSTARFGYGREMVTSTKLRKIRNCAIYYLKQNKKLESRVRFDCIEIMGQEITHIKAIL